MVAGHRLPYSDFYTRILFPDLSIFLTEYFGSQLLNKIQQPLRRTLGHL
jgi:hypothetical protein